MMKEYKNEGHQMATPDRYLRFRFVVMMEEIP
jgi:hypothetical protein